MPKLRLGVTAVLLLMTVLWSACSHDLDGTELPCSQSQPCPAGSACSSGRCVVSDASSQDHKLADLTPDLAPDRGIPDARQPDARRDLGQPDAPRDQGQPDQGQPDQASPDAKQQDQAQPDQAKLDQAQPDLPLPDLGPPDVITGEGVCTGCTLGGKCVPPGYKDPTSAPCRTCDPNHSKTLWAPAPGCVITFAGGGTKGDGPWYDASFKGPEKVYLGSAGQLYVVDSKNNKLRSISQGIVKTIFGPSNFKGLKDVAVASPSKFFIADWENHKIKVWDQGTIATYAGSSKSLGHKMFGGPRLSATFWKPRGLMLDSKGTLWVADEFNHAIRHVSSTTVSTFIGGDSSNSDGYVNDTFSKSKVRYPKDMLELPGGNVLIADAGNCVVRLVDYSVGKVSTFAGKGGKYCGALANGHRTQAAQFKGPTSVAVDKAGTIYVADPGNNAVRLIKGDQVTTPIGGLGQGKANGSLTNATFYAPHGVAVDANGYIYIADTNNNLIRVAKLK